MNKLALLGALFAMLLAGAWIYHLSVGRADIRFLPDYGGSEWIVYPTPPDAHVYNVINTHAEFRRSFVLQELPPKATMTFAAFSNASITLNNQAIACEVSGNWKKPQTCEISKSLRIGTNEIVVRATNKLAPPALYMRIEAGATNITTDEQWQCSLMGAVPMPAVRASDPGEIRPGNALYGRRTFGDAIRSGWPMQLMFLFAAAALTIALNRWPLSQRVFLTTRRFVIFLGLIAGALALLVFNNCASIPNVIGFDAPEHLEYIHYIQKNGRLPLANEGWEMFQPPLYYIISAVLLKLTGISTPGGEAIALRCLGLIIAVTNIVLISAILQQFFNRALPLLFGMLVAAILPAQLCLAHYPTNELLAATLVSASIYLCVRILKSDPRRITIVSYLLLGTCLGAALLTKATALIAIPLVFGALLIRFYSNRTVRISHIGLTLLACLAVSAWHYIRVWKHFGNPLIGNWDLATGQQWWQPKGYQTAAYFLRFGEAFVTPYFSGLDGFWDGLYSTLWADGLYSGRATVADAPPWNLNEMTVACVLALIPTIAIALGALAAFRSILVKPTAEGLLLLSLVGLTFLAIIYMSLKVPSYAQVKSFYGLIALAPLCVFATMGFELLSKQKIVITAVMVGFAMWVVNSYAAFFIRPNAPDTSKVLVASMIRENRFADAKDRLATLLQDNPKNADAWAMLANLLLVAGHAADAEGAAEKGLAIDPTHTQCRYWLIAAKAEQRQFESAVEQGFTLSKAAPDHPVLFRNLATWLLMTGKTNEAIATGRESLRITPYDAQCHANLGMAMVRAGDLEGAMPHLVIPIEVQPNRLEPRLGVARVLYKEQHYDAALSRYREVLQINPNHTEALQRTAWLLATGRESTSQDREEATKLAERAVQSISDPAPELLDTLAASYAAVGRFEQALKIATDALDKAVRMGNEQLQHNVQARMELYQQGQPFRR